MVGRGIGDRIPWQTYPVAVGAGGVESSGFGLPQKPAAFFKKICEQKRDVAPESSRLTEILKIYDNDRLGYDDGSCDRCQ